MAQLSSMSVLAAVASVIDDGVDVVGVSAIRASGTDALDKVIADWRIASASTLHHTDKSQSQMQMEIEHKLCLYASKYMLWQTCAASAYLTLLSSQAGEIVAESTQ